MNPLLTYILEHQIVPSTLAFTSLLLLLPPESFTSSVKFTPKYFILFDNYKWYYFLNFLFGNNELIISV